jgi:hypothetical protein
MSLPAGATADVSSEEDSVHCVLPAAEAGCRPAVAAPRCPCSMVAVGGVDQQQGGLPVPVVAAHLEYPEGGVVLPGRPRGSRSKTWPWKSPTSSAR